MKTQRKPVLYSDHPIFEALAKWKERRAERDKVYATRKAWYDSLPDNDEEPDEAFLEEERRRWQPLQDAINTETEAWMEVRKILLTIEP
jgi:hypothetical protein